MMRFLPLAAWLLLSSGCAFMQPSPQLEYNWANNQKLVLQQPNWRAKGRILIRNADNSWQANLEWQHTEQLDRLQFRTALGQTVLTIESMNQVVAVTDDQGVTSLGSEQELLAAHGLTAPLDALGFWVRGVPKPDISYSRTGNQDPEANGFDQDGWQIRYDRYDLVQQLWLPHRVSLRQNEVLLRYVIDEWT